MAAKQAEEHSTTIASLLLKLQVLPVDTTTKNIFVKY